MFTERCDHEATVHEGARQFVLHAAHAVGVQVLEYLQCDNQVGPWQRRHRCLLGHGVEGAREAVEFAAIPAQQVEARCRHVDYVQPHAPPVGNAQLLGHTQACLRHPRTIVHEREGLSARERTRQCARKGGRITAARLERVGQHPQGDHGRTQAVRVERFSRRLVGKHPEHMRKLEGKVAELLAGVSALSQGCETGKVSASRQRRIDAQPLSIPQDEAALEARQLAVVLWARISVRSARLAQQRGAAAGSGDRLPAAAVRCCGTGGREEHMHT
eukprot:5641688-Prymnesium_polylepis.2